MSKHEVDLPAWACVGDKRRAHIGRVTALLDEWAKAMKLTRSQRTDWHDAGRLHDALRDAPEDLLRSLAGDLPGFSIEMLHGPAAAERLIAGGETRTELVDRKSVV